jgi:thermostable 8-oxoguanine DNA glycosylase
MCKTMASRSWLIQVYWIEILRGVHILAYIGYADIFFIDRAICRVAKQLAVSVNRGLTPGKDQPATMV